MMSYTNRPMVVTPWASKRQPQQQYQQQYDEGILLSKSMGDIPGFDLLSRTSSEVASIDHRGYLLKRSNDPIENVSATISTTFPELSRDEHDYHAVRGGDDGFHLPLHQTLQVPNLMMTSLSSAATTLPATFASETTTVTMKQRGTTDTQPTVVTRRVKTPVEKSCDLLADFFGADYETDMGPLDDEEDNVTPKNYTTIAMSNNSSVPVRTVPIITPPTIEPKNDIIFRSSPIAFGAAATAAVAADHPSNIQRRDTMPPPGKSSPPLDFVDDKDGHLWRAKYCVLEDGVLYFYRNLSDGESAEAHAERQQPNGHSYESSASPDGGDLSKSPMPRKFIHDLSKSPMPRKLVSDLNNTSSTSSPTRSVIWEKRVALDCVGAVRSAELEHGAFAFELLAADDNDRLILKASDTQELKEWLFQFHRSLASFVKNYMMTAALGQRMDLHQPSAAFHNSNSGSSFLLTEQPHDFMSPKTASFQKWQSPALSASLSHGHGRSGMHRRRRAEEEEKSCLEEQIPIQFSFEQAAAAAAAAAAAPTTVSSRRPTPPPVEEEQTLTIVKQLSEPEIAGGCPPETERPVTSSTPKKGKYVPPHLRPKTLEKPPKKKSAYLPPHLRRKLDAPTGDAPSLGLAPAAAAAATPFVPKDAPPVVAPQDSPLWLGGCAHPTHGSIMDSAYKKRNTSKVGKVAAEAVGFYGGGNSDASSSVDEQPSLHFEVGTVSECGVRTSNEDSFLICSSASKAFAASENEEEKVLVWGKHDAAFFGIFDGHCGNEAARFSAEHVDQYLFKEWLPRTVMEPRQVVEAVEAALKGMDTDFCRICVEDGRNWESGSTAIVAAIVDEHLIVTNIGDCQAVICRSTEAASNDDHETMNRGGWSHLEIDEDLSAQWIQATSGQPPAEDDKSMRDWYWKEMANVHSPSREDEQRRIEKNNGWITRETEIPGMGQLHRMDFCDEAVVEILKRCFSDRYNQSQSSSAQKKNFSAAPQRIIEIARVCGELAVSRAIGDRDFKANQQNTNGGLGEEDDPKDLWWECPSYLPRPDGHSGKCKGDLVSSVAESRSMKISLEGQIDEFLVLACDGLWDVMDPDDAVRVTRGLLFDKKWPARKAAARLAELAIHLGSSDNITVIVIRFYLEAG